MAIKESFEESQIREELRKLDERRNYLLKKLNDLNVWQKKDNSYEKCAAIAQIINNIYAETDLDKKAEYVYNNIMKFCQKNRHECYSVKEMIEKLNNVHKILSQYKGDTLNENAKIYFLSVIYPKIAESGPEDFPYDIYTMKNNW